MKIIDIHAHVYGPTGERSGSSAEALLRQMDACKVEKAVMMANPLYGYHNQYLKESVLKYKGRLAGVALVDVLKGRAAANELDGIYRDGVLMGMKIEGNSTFGSAPLTRLTDPVLEPVWECMEEWRQPMFLHIFRKCDIEDIRPLAIRYPHVKMIFCHMGADAVFRSENRRTVYEEFLGIVRDNSNLYVDTSTVPEYFEEKYPYPEAVKAVEYAWKALGPEKIMWATDYPGMLYMGTYEHLINYVWEGCRNIPAAHREMIMGKNAEKLFFS